MAAKVSPEMQKARALIAAGKGKVTAYAAAKATGLTTGAITRSKWYRDFVAALPPTDPKTDPLERARVLVVDKGYSANKAADATGISHMTIRRAPWYKSHVEQLVENFRPGGKFHRG